MRQSSPTSDSKEKTGGHIVYWLAVALVILGLLNVTPAIPGLSLIHI